MNLVSAVLACRWFLLYSDREKEKEEEEEEVDNQGEIVRDAFILLSFR